MSHRHARIYCPPGPRRGLLSAGSKYAPLQLKAIADHELAPTIAVCSQKTLVNRGFLVASIFLLGAGCRVPVLDRHALASVTTPIQQVSKPLFEPASFVKQMSLESSAEATEARLSQIDAGDRSTSQVDQSGLSHSTGNIKFRSLDPKAQGGAESNLAAAEAWKFDRHSDAQTDQGISADCWNMTVRLL